MQMNIIRLDSECCKITSTPAFLILAALWNEMKTTMSAKGGKQQFSGMQREIDFKGFEIPNLRGNMLESEGNSSEDDTEQLATQTRLIQAETPVRIVLSKTWTRLI